MRSKIVWAFAVFFALFSSPSLRTEELPQGKGGEARESRLYQGHQAPVRCVAFFPDGKTIASGSGSWSGDSDLSLRLWDLDSGKELHRFEGYQGALHCLAISRDGKWILSGSGRSVGFTSYVDSTVRSGTRPRDG